MPWNASSFRAWAEISIKGLGIPLIGAAFTDPVFISDIINFSANFELNAIPKAAMTLALGRRADDLNKAAIIHKIINYMKINLPVSVWLEAANTDDDGIPEKWPKNPDGTAKAFKIFEGITTGAGYRKAMGNAQFVLYATHWLEDLNFSSAVSRAFQPLAPDQFSFMPAFVNFNSGLAKDFLTTTLSHDRFNANVVAQDLWGYIGPKDNKGIIRAGGIKQWFTELASQDMIMAQEIMALGTTTSSHKNDEALAALAKIEPIPGISDTGYLDTIALQLDIGADFVAQAADQIAQAVAKESFESMASHTFWDKLINQFASEFLFSICPCVEKALIVPFTPGLRKEYLTIYKNEYDSLEVNLSMPRLTRGVALLMGVTMPAGSDIQQVNPPPQQPISPFKTIGGWFQGRDSGVIIFKQPPSWITNIALPFLEVHKSIPVNIPINNILFPAVVAAAAANDLANKYSRAKKLWDKYAQALYIQEILRGRSAQISGKLRFDIAPGSCVKIEGSQEPFTDDAVGQDFWGSVLRVSITLDAESQRAGTSFHIGYIRDDAENKDDSTSIDAHPLWKGKWKGAPLQRSGKQDA